MKTRTLFLFFILIGSAFAGSKPEIKADKVLILKKEHTLQLLRDGKPFKSYKVALGGHPEGAKTQAGDSRTPEGNYVIDSHNANSQFHLALHISYPSAADAANARARGLRPGGSIMIHGLPKQYAWLGAAHRLHDWTLGCIAVTNPEIEEIWRLVPNGTPIETRP